MRRSSLRTLATLCCLTLFAPGAAHATTASLTGPYSDARANHSEAEGAPLHRNIATASATADRLGSMTGSAAIESKFGGEIPFVLYGSATATSEVILNSVLPEGTTQVAYTAHVHVNSAEATQVASRLGSSQ